MHGFPRGKTAIVGAATFGVGKAPGFEAIDLAAQASLLALAQAGLTPADVDALFIAQPQDTLAGLSFAEYLGIQPKLTDNNRTGGSAFLLHLSHAALALDAGPVRRGADRLRQQPGHRHRQAAEHEPLVGLRSAVQAAAPDLVVCARRGAPHAPVRHDEAPARRGRGRGAALGAAQSRSGRARAARDRRRRQCAHGVATRSACATAASSPTAPRRS